MHNKLFTIIMAASSAIGAFADDCISASFSQTPMPEALSAIEQLAGDGITVNFSYRKLEDYTVTTDIIEATPMQAISQAIGFYPIKATRSGRVITVQPILDSEYKITGRLVDESGDGIDFATIAVVSLPDSAIISSGVSNVRGDFVLPLMPKPEMALKATRIGYKPAIVPARVGNMGDVQMSTDPQMLKTLTAYADKNIISTAGSVTKIRVEGTPYSTIGTLADLLPNLPGFAPDSKAFATPGTAGTVYYINGREVSETSQLGMLRSDQVKAISIDKDPGAEYPADAAVVVNISTIKSPDDFISLRLSNAEQIRHKLSDVPSLDFSLQIGKFTTSLNYRYDYMLSQTEDDYRRFLVADTYVIGVERSSIFNNKNKGSRLNWSGELQFGPHNRLGLYYYYYDMRHQAVSNGDLYAYPSFVPNDSHIQFQNWHGGNSALHSGTICFDHTGKSFTAHIAQDLAYTNPYSGTTISEMQKGQLTKRYDSHDHEYAVSTTNIKLGLRFPWSMMLTAGGRLSYIESNSSRFLMDGSSNGDAFDYGSSDSGYYEPWLNGSNHMNVTETTAQGFVALSQRIGNVTIAPGLRYEYVDRTINDNGRINMPAGSGNISQSSDYTYDKSYGHLLPSLTVKYAAGQFHAALNYTRRMSQPTFSMLNSGLVYEDDFTYSNCNPELKASQIDEVRFWAGYKGFVADFGFRSIDNPIAEVYTLVNKGAVSFLTPINMRRFNECDFNVSYTSTFGALGCYASAGIVIPGWNDLPYSGQKVTFNGELNLTYRINSIFSLYTNFKHYGSMRWMVYDRLDSQIWNFGASASLLSNRLTINLEATDLLDSNYMSFISTSYGGLTNDRIATMDTRGISVRLSYALFNKNIRSNVKRGNIDDIDRIER